jgi:hypothetical protein
MDFDVNKMLDAAGDGLSSMGEATHKAASDFNKNFVADKLPDLGKYGDVAEGAAELLPGVGEYNAVVKGDWVGVATAAGIDVGAVAAGTLTAGTGYAGVKAGAAAAKAGVKVGAKELAKTGAEKVAKETAEKSVKAAAGQGGKEVSETALEKALATSGEKVHPQEKASAGKIESSDAVAVKKLDVGDAMRTEKFGDYLKDIETQTGRKIGNEQRTLIDKALSENTYKKLDQEGIAASRGEFTLKKPDMIAEWEKQTGEKWPVYTKEVKGEDGSIVRLERKYDAHHIIENQFGGPNEWYNITPAGFPSEHQGGIHRAGGVAQEVFGG